MGQAKGLVELGDFRELSDEPLQLREGFPDFPLVCPAGRPLEEPLGLVEVPPLRRTELHNQVLRRLPGLLGHHLDPGGDEGAEEAVPVGDDLVKGGRRGSGAAQLQRGTVGNILVAPG